MGKLGSEMKALAKKRAAVLKRWMIAFTLCSGSAAIYAR
jgi:hypothetical protein